MRALRGGPSFRPWANCCASERDRCPIGAGRGRMRHLPVPGAAMFHPMFRRMLLTTLAAAVLAPMLLSAAAACQSPAGAGGMVQQTLAEVNAFRQARGLVPLQADPRLQQAAQVHACDSAARGRMGHDGSDGATLADRVGRTGYPFRAVAENLAAGYPDARSVVRGWVDSRSHRQNLLMRDARDSGIGLARDGRGALHWVLVLGAAQP